MTHYFTVVYASLLRQNLEFARKLIFVPTEDANADKNPA